MPKLWSATIAEHREAVREALLDTAGRLVDEHGPAGLTMSRLAERSGIGRATVYRYFADSGAALDAWHERQVGTHLQRLGEVRDRSATAEERLDGVLTEYARVLQSQPRGELSAALHRSEHVTRAHGQLHAIVAEALAGAVSAGVVRRDVPVAELVPFCISALGAARDLRTDAEVRRLVGLIRAALRPGDPVGPRGEDPV